MRTASSRWSVELTLCSTTLAGVSQERATDASAARWKTRSGRTRATQRAGGLGIEQVELLERERRLRQRSPADAGDLGVPLQAERGQVLPDEAPGPRDQHPHQEAGTSSSA